LNADAQAKLMQLSEAQQQVVLSDFDPPAGAAEVNGKFIRFATSIQNSQALGQVPLDPATAFIQRWNLNADAQAKLMQLDESQQQVVFSNFDPPAGATEVNGKFIRFASSIQNSQALGQVPLDPATAFIQRWNLNADAQAKLMELDESQQQVVLSKFDPPAGATEVNGKFIRFATSIQNSQATGYGQAKQQLDPVTVFIQQWNLNSDAQSKLMELDQSQLEVVLSDFQPPLGASEVNGKLIRFAASIQKNQAAGYVHIRQHVDPVTAFIQQWNLNADAQAKLMELDQSQLEVVLSDFQPPAGATEVNGKFIRFASSIQKNQTGGYVVVQNRNMDPVTAFIHRWNLNEDAQAQLMQLTPQQVEIVISGFQPPPGAQEVNGKFIRFASSIRRNQASGW